MEKGIDRTEASFKLTLDQYPSGRYGFCGSIPIELCKWKEGLFSQYVSIVFETKEEAIQKAKDVGIDITTIDIR